MDMKLTVNVDVSASGGAPLDVDRLLEGVDLDALFYVALANAICTEEEKAADDFPHLPAGITSTVEFGEDGDFDDSPLVAINFEPCDMGEDSCAKCYDAGEDSYAKPYGGDEDSCAKPYGGDEDFSVIRPMTEEELQSAWADMEPLFGGSKGANFGMKHDLGAKRPRRGRRWSL